MYYLNPTPTSNGSYGNPQSNGREGMYALPDELLGAYLETMGFATLTLDGDTVTAVAVNREAYDAYQAEHPAPAGPTPAEQRENAYNTEEIIDWNGEKITVTAAAELFNYYNAEGSGKADELRELIKAAKADIRERYPD